MIRKEVFCFLLLVTVIEIDGQLGRGSSSYRGRERSSSDDNTCQLEPEVGQCRAIIKRWHYNTTSRACETFDWGGCGGNDNRFETKAACEAKCAGGSDSRWQTDRFRSVTCAVMNPKCSNECAFGRARDAKGCPTCTCNPRRSYRRPSQLPVDASTCDDEPSVQCTLYCEHGFKRDDKGCNLCQCDKDAPVASQLPAASAAVVAKSNCPRPKCKYDCTFGYQTNSYGCPTCACRPRSRYYSRRRSCSDISATCRMYCEHGFAKDENGCDVCGCADAVPARPAVLPASPVVISRSNATTTTDCLRRRTCRMHCEHGFVKDEAGCDSCACAEAHVDLRSPSSDHCPSMSRCRLRCHYAEFKKGSDGCDICACADGW